MGHFIPFSFVFVRIPIAIIIFIVVDIIIIIIMNDTNHINNNFGSRWLAWLKWIEKRSISTDLEKERFINLLIIITIFLLFLLLIFLLGSYLNLILLVQENAVNHRTDDSKMVMLGREVEGEKMILFFRWWVMIMILQTHTVKL